MDRTNQPCAEVGSDDSIRMRQALELATATGERGEVPVGAVLVRDGAVIGTGANCVEGGRDPTCHAEMLAIRQAAGTLGAWRLTGCTLYVTLEPCCMCAGAIVWSRLERLVFGAPDPKAGACGSLRNVVQDERLNHRCAVTGGVLEVESAALLRAFFAGIRAASD